MAKGLEEMLRDLLADPATVARQADLMQAATLARQELSHRQRAGAAATRLQRARAEGAEPGEIAALEARLQGRLARLDAARMQAGAADVKRPLPEKDQAQILARATGEVAAPPLTLAALDRAGAPVAQQAANDAGIVHLKVKGDLARVTLQLSDCEGRVVYRGARPVSVAAGEVYYLDAAVSPPRPQPCPVPPRAKMPDLVGQGAEVAQALLERLGVGKVTTQTRVGDGLPGIVIAQDPAAGTTLGDKTGVTLTLRKARAGKPQPVYVPDLTGAPLATALARLGALDLVHDLKYRVSDGAADVVLSQAPEAGSEIDAGGRVTLTVSKLREAGPETVTVPDLVGKPGDMARDVLVAVGLSADISQTARAGAGRGVIAQDPQAGAVVKRGTTVTITLNTPPAPDAGRVVVPHLAGRGEDAAQAVLARLKLHAKVARRKDAAPMGQVIAQDPPAGDRVARDSAVALTVSSGAGGKGGASGDLDRLAQAMARDPRAEVVGDATRIGAILHAAGIETQAQAELLAELPAEDLRARLNLGRRKAAAGFRAMLRKALKDRG